MQRKIPNIMKRVSQRGGRESSADGLQDRKLPQVKGCHLSGETKQKKTNRLNWFHVKSDAEMTVTSWVSAGSLRPPLPSSLHTVHGIREAIWRTEAAGGDGSPPFRKQSSVSIYTVTSVSSCCKGPFIGMTPRSRKWWRLLSVSGVVLQTESVTWRWTPTPWRCPCRTPTPGRRPWTTWGCPPLESADNSFCQVRRYWDISC